MYQIVFKKSLENHKDSKGDQKKKKKTLKEILATDTTATTNSKNSLASSQININSHTKGLFISVPFIQCSMSSFQEKNYKTY